MILHEPFTRQWPQAPLAITYPHTAYVHMYVCMYYGMIPIRSSNNLNTFVKDTQAYHEVGT